MIVNIIIIKIILLLFHNIKINHCFWFQRSKTKKLVFLIEQGFLYNNQFESYKPLINGCFTRFLIFDQIDNF